jgi:hypothetical protein
MDGRIPLIQECQYREQADGGAAAILEWNDATYENNRLGRELAGDGIIFSESNA